MSAKHLVLCMADHRGAWLHAPGYAAPVASLLAAWQGILVFQGLASVMVFECAVLRLLSVLAAWCCYADTVRNMM
jgi:hypothetical protein